MGIRFRFSLLILLSNLLFVGLFATLIFFQVRSRLIRDAQQTLALHVEHEWNHFESPHEEEIHDTGSPHVKDSYLRFWKNGTLFYDSFPKNTKSPLPPQGVSDTAIVVKMSKVRDGDQFELVGLHDLASTRGYLKTLRNTLLFGWGLAVVLLFPISLFCMKLLLKPFTQLSLKTSELEAQKLSFRFPESKIRDEYGLLVKSFNLLLERLEKSFSQMRYFAGQASHELRTPLAVIIAQSEMHLRKNQECPSVQKILVHSQQLSSLISQLLLISELDRAESGLKMDRVDVGERVEGIIDAFKSRFSLQNKTLTITKSGELQALETNGPLFQSIVSNLIENAMKFSAGQVRVSTSQDGDSIGVVVEDDGPGISVLEREQVLAPFYKARLLKDGRKNEGHGLGLTIVKGCVEVLHGNLELDDSPLGGLRAKVSFPLEN